MKETDVAVLKSVVLLKLLINVLFRFMFAIK